LSGLLVALPFIAGLGLDLYLFFRLRNIPIVYLRADLGVLALLLGIFITIPLVLYLAMRMWADARVKKELSAAQDAFSDERLRFFRRLDHELKNPLTAIRAGLANLHDSISPQSRQEVLETVDSQAMRLSRLAGDLRKLSDLETRTLEKTTVNLTPLLEELYAISLDKANEEDRRLTLTLPRAPWPLPQIEGDPDLLVLAVHNLIDNALKFTRPGDTIEVRAFEDGTNIVIEIADTGPGIPEEEIPHVFEELYRGQGARGVAGSGLGLALVRAIAERHNGSVSLRSRKGQGTVFSLRLPAGAQAGERRPVASSSGATQM
jgi:two-component system OmpR family sensor kinase